MGKSITTFVNSVGRVCVQCKIFKPWDAFHKSKINKSKRHPTCRSCFSVYNISRGTYRRRTLKEKYGITPEDYDQILKQQNGVCALCGKFPQDGKRLKKLIIEHDHQRKKVRGLTHQYCNTIIAVVENSADLIKKAQEYLEVNK